MQSKTRKVKDGGSVKEHLLLTRYDAERVARGEMLSVADVEEILAIPLLGIIPESKSVLAASNSGEPVILDEESDAGQAYADAIWIGYHVPPQEVFPGLALYCLICLGEVLLSSIVPGGFPAVGWKIGRAHV